jgi:RNA polymerase primary sigma factor
MIKQSSNTIDLYLRSLNKYPQLTHEQLVELFVKIRDNNEDANKKKEQDRARKKVIESNLRLVVSIAKVYYKMHKLTLSMEDLVQEGNLGLMKAVERFDHTRGLRFSTYATWWIKQSIGQHVLKRKRTVRLPAHVTSLQKQLYKANEDFFKERGYEPTEDDLMEVVNASEKIVKATMYASRGTVSIHGTVSDNCESKTFEETLEDESSSPFDNVSDAEVINIVKKVLDSFSQKETAIIRLRFGLCEDACDHEQYPITQDELSSLENGNGMTDSGETL